VFEKIAGAVAPSRKTTARGTYVCRSFQAWRNGNAHQVLDALTGRDRITRGVPMAKVVVTGGSGFIRLRMWWTSWSRRRHQVTVVDHRVRTPRFGYEDVDLMDLSSRVLAATRDAEHIFHLAAVSNVN